MKSSYALAGFALSLSVLLTLSHTLLRSAAAYPSVELTWLVRVGAALLLYGFVFFAYTALLKYYDISVLYPLYTALSIIGVFIVGVFYFGEPLSIQKIAGVFFLILGVFLLSV